MYFSPASYHLLLCGFIFINILLLNTLSVYSSLNIQRTSFISIPFLVSIFYFLLLHRCEDKKI